MMIRVDDLSYTYGDGTAALRGVSFAIREGEKVAVVGPNGAGKSTLLILLNGIIEGKGTIIIDNIRLNKKNLSKVRRKLGLVFQDPEDQIFSPTVFDDVAFAPLNTGLSSEEVRKRVTRALSFVGLSGYEMRSPFHLSFGEKKRVSLAGVLAQEPKVLLLDEPTGNLDPKRRREIISWMINFKGTLLVATHDLDMAYEVCSRCLALNQGQVVGEGDAASILKDRAFLEENDLELPLAIGGQAHTFCGKGNFDL